MAERKRSLYTLSKHELNATVFDPRIKQVFLFLGGAFIVFLGLMAYYQIVHSSFGNRYVKSAFLQRRESVPASLARGYLLDTNGVPLHYPCWHPVLAVFPSKIGDKDLFAKKIAALICVDENLIREALEDRTTPFKITLEPSLFEMERIIGSAIPGLALVPEEIRYGYGSLARHVLGYVRPNAYLNPEDNVGESGLESWYQSVLIGGIPTWAGTFVTGEGAEIPGSGIRMGSGREHSTDLLTTLDARIQLGVEQALGESEISKGAAVVLEVETGEILALASLPQYNQNHPEDSLFLPDSPFLNRAILDFAPGSIWKPLVLTLALEKGYVAPDEIFECKGQVTVGSAVVNCALSRGGHGRVTLKEALAQSCNSAFIEIGLRIPPEELVDWALKCGFGRRLSIPLAEQSEGLLPEPGPMLDGDVANYSIGQGYLTITPLQAACFFRSIVSGGNWINPTLVRGTGAEERVLFSDATAVFLQEALLLSTLEGIGKAAWVSGYGSAGKTGTAETEGESSLDHAWFVGWTPILAPKYVICVFCERSGTGPSLAAPLFRRIGEIMLLQYP